MGRRPRLDDNDVRLRSDHAKISAIVHCADGKLEEFQIRKALWRSATRSKSATSSPLILLYASNEATCSAMKVKPIKRTGDSYNDSMRRNEEFLYTSERTLHADVTNSSADRPFGHSRLVREFVKRMLITFSPDMGDFFWRFEPYDFSLILPQKATPDSRWQSRVRGFAMRWVTEAIHQRRRPIVWPDQTKVVLRSNGSEHERRDRSLPDPNELWERMELDPADRKFLQSCALEVRLTPRIMIRRKTGTFSLSQLSDGEQRLFSLFVDIARQLSINNHMDDIGQSEAIVLIDEIDVHLHPKWQRRIVPALEDLFPRCQFIATTHSPFVIQATRRQQITSIEKGFLHADMSGGNSIEDIVEDIQGISIPQRSIRAEKLNAAAKHYFELLALRNANQEKVSDDNLHAAERAYRHASEPFTSDSAIHALLNVVMKEGTR